MPQRRTHRFTVTIDAPLTRADIPRLCRDAALILSCTPTTTVVCDIAAVRDPDAAALDAVARLALTARRFGAAVELRNACPNLVELLEFAGLSDVIRATDVPGHTH